ncbi:MAG: hypothetical protein ACREQ5_36640 [Candidatus Dormibacteria bacterium]
MSTAEFVALVVGAVIVVELSGWPLLDEWPLPHEAAKTATAAAAITACDRRQLRGRIGVMPKATALGGVSINRWLLSTTSTPARGVELLVRIGRTA